MDLFLQLVITGVMLGSIFALVSLGWSSSTSVQGCSILLWANLP